MNMNFAITFKTHRNDKAVVSDEVAVEWGRRVNDVYIEIGCGKHRTVTLFLNGIMCAIVFFDMEIEGFGS